MAVGLLSEQKEKKSQQVHPPQPDVQVLSGMVASQMISTQNDSQVRRAVVCTLSRAPDEKGPHTSQSGGGGVARRLARPRHGVPVGWEERGAARIQASEEAAGTWRASSPHQAL